MRPAITFSCILILHTIAFSQNTNTQRNPLEIISAVKKAQESLNTISYTLERHDTLVSGVRTMTGHALIQVAREDTVFGFLFQAKKDGFHGESLYDGRIAYATNDDQRTYRFITRAADLPHAFGDPGGQIIMTDLVTLDTTQATDIKAWEDQQNAYLLFTYADITAYDVVKRSKTVTINKKTMLPMAVRRHQETLDKVQDLYFAIKDIQINDPSFRYDFSSPEFLKTYSQQNTKPDKSLQNLKGQLAPEFALSSFSNTKVSSAGLMGKAILLDFWEVWCGPCIESMPKVQRLYDTYKHKGLNVFGVTNDLKLLDAAKRFAEKREFSFPMLIGNEQLIKDYKVNGVPQYVLIDKQGKVSFISVGYSDELETAIKNILID